MTTTRARLTASQTVDLQDALEDRDRSPVADKVYRRSARSARISLTDDEIAWIQTELEGSGDIEWLWAL